MATLPLRWSSRSHPPADPVDRRDWLAAQEERIARIARREMVRIVDEAYGAFLGTLTASGDLSAFDSIPIRWEGFLADEFIEMFGGMFLDGSLSSWVQAPATAALPATAASGWASVVNNAAVVYQRTATNRLVGVGDNIWRTVRSMTVQAINTGATTEELKGSIQTYRQFSEFRADTIARTETVAAFNGGHFEGGRALGEYGPKMKRWTAALDARTRPAHVDADGQTVPYNEPFIVDGEEMMFPHADGASAANVVNCIVEGQIALPVGELLSSARMRWHGETYEIVTADGESLILTPNHPVLSPAGWKPAKLIKPGDDVVSIRLPINQPDNEHRPARVEELHAASRVSAGAVVASVRGMNFHGDRPDGKIEVVGTAGQLNDRIELGQSGAGLLFVAELDTERSLAIAGSNYGAPEGPLTQVIAERSMNRTGLAVANPPSIVGVSGKFSPLLNGHLLHPQDVCLATGTDRQATLSQTVCDRGAVNAESMGDCEHALASFVSLTKVIKVNVSSGSHWVYNLTSETGFLWSPAFVHSNCRCGFDDIYEGDENWVPTPVDYTDLVNSEQARVQALIDSGAFD
jgi:hypothetical protein